MLIDSLAAPFRKVRAANSTAANFAAKTPVGVKPAGAGVLDWGVGAVAPGLLLCVPFGEGSDNQTFSVRIIGWRSVGADPAAQLWVPTTLCEFSATLSTVVGVAGRVVTAAERFADTISLVTGVGVVYDQTSNAQPAMLAVAPLGCGLVEVDFDMTGATSGNLLVAQA